MEIDYKIQMIQAKLKYQLLDAMTLACYPCSHLLLFFFLFFEREPKKILNDRIFQLKATLISLY